MAFGARAARVASAERFEDAFVEALRYAGPTVIHVDMAALSPLRPTLST
ncbi:hypothetical protein GCM10023175_24370 [Pseudonocardia xishanensis]|uniref:Thiamine pyrophosphate-dependent enzyme n=1 Tax=Pseudonocardia xishanensis TaxID=630995 RepID=A0ABP8RS95_9PSEU